MNLTMNEHGNTVGTGAIGMAASLGSLAVSVLGDLEPWLRVGSLAVGIAVGLLTIRKLLKS